MNWFRRTFTRPSWPEFIAMAVAKQRLNRDLVALRTELERSNLDRDAAAQLAGRLAREVDRLEAQLDESLGHQADLAIAADNAMKGHGRDGRGWGR